MMLKSAGAVLPVEIAWADQLAAGETIQTASWSVSPVEVGGLQIDSDSETGAVATAMVSGGKIGRIYQLTNEVVTVAGYRVQRSIGIRIGAERAAAL